MGASGRRDPPSEDLESAKLRLYGVPNAPEGVNGTVVDWSKHPGAWLPFDMPEAVEPGSGAAADGADSKEANTTCLAPGAADCGGESEAASGPVAPAFGLLASLPVAPLEHTAWGSAPGHSVGGRSGGPRRAARSLER